MRNASRSPLWEQFYAAIREAASYAEAGPMQHAKDESHRSIVAPDPLLEGVSDDTAQSVKWIAEQRSIHANQGEGEKL